MSSSEREAARLMPRESLRLILYGPAHAPVRRLLHDQRFRELVVGLLEHGAVAGAGEPIDAGDARGASSLAPAVAAGNRRVVAGTLAERALDAGLLVRQGEQYVASSSLVLVPVTAEADLRAILLPVLDRYCEVVETSLPALKQAYAPCAAARHFEWDAVAHSLVAGMLADLSVGWKLQDLGYALPQKIQSPVVWAIAGLSAANPFGVQCVGSSTSRSGVAQLWHAAVDRPDLRVNAGVVDTLRWLCNGPTVEPSARTGLLLSYLGLVSRSARGGLSLTIPAFDAHEMGRLLGVLHAAARELVIEAVQPVLAGALEHPWWRRLAANRCYQHAAVRIILEYATDRLIESALLPPFPAGKSVSPAWGRWLWSEPDGPAGLVSGLLS